MAKPIITIVGLGWIGCSIGKALKKAGGNFEIVGHDREPGANNVAKKYNAVDRTSWNLISAVEQADLVILATPVSAVHDTLKAMGSELKQNCVVMDTCAIKAPVLAWADELLPATVSFVGGDPIMQTPPPEEGKPGSDIGSADLFAGAMFCLCPSPRAQAAAVQLASDLVATLGANPYFLDATEHDGLLAGVEHLPTVFSAALLLSASEAPAWREARKVAGDAFRRASQLPSGPAEALRSITLSNSRNVVRRIDDVIAKLETLRAAVNEEDEKTLDEMFEQAIRVRERWLSDRAKGFAGEDVPAPPEVPSYWKSMFGFGGMRRKEPEAKDDKGKR